MDESQQGPPSVTEVRDEKTLSTVLSYDPVEADVPEIRLKTYHYQNIPLVNAAIAQSNCEPWLFRKDGKVYCAMSIEGEQKLKPLDKEKSLAQELYKRFKWLHPTRKGEHIPKEVLTYLLEDETACLLPLRRILNHPVILPNGEMCIEPGYYDVDGSGVFMLHNPLANSGLNLPSSPEQALSTLRDILVDFKFADEASKTHAILYILQPYLRLVLADSHRPGTFIFSKHHGAGKSLLSDVLNRLGQGRHIADLPLGESDAETRKRIFALLDAGANTLYFDNIDNKQRMDRSVLAEFLTSTSLQDRLLQHSRVVERPNDAVVLMNGNAPTLTDELQRRFVYIHLNGDFTEDRAFSFRDILTEVHVNYPKYAASALCLVKCWVEAGMPTSSSYTLNSFERWSGIMGGIAEHYGLEGFLQNTPKYSGSPQDAFEEFLQCCHTHFQGREFTAAAALPIAKELPNILDIGNNSDDSLAKILGHLLSGNLNKSCGKGLILKACYKANKRIYRFESSDTTYDNVSSIKQHPVKGAEPKAESATPQTKRKWSA